MPLTSALFKGQLYEMISSSNNDNFTSSFLIWMPFISLSCLITLADTCSTMLNQSGDCGHPCLVLDFRIKTVTLSPLSVILAVGLL